AQINGQEGQGILLINGGLSVQGGFQFYGITIVKGSVKTAGGGGTPAHFWGSLMAQDTVSFADTVNNFTGGATMLYSKCAIIKAAGIDHSGSEAELVKVATTEVAADAIVEGEVMDPGIVAEAIRGLFSTAGVKQKSVVTAVGGRDVIVKKIQMDRMKEGDAREVIRWEAEQHVPFDMANVELDFQILDPDAEGLQMNVLLVAAKRELVESRTSLLGEAGLNASVIDVDAFAIHNAFELNHPDAMQGVVGLVNIGHEVTNVNIVEDGVPVLTRDLSVGTRRFREDLQREKGLSAEDSERLIQGLAQSADLAPYVRSEEHTSELQS